MGAVSNFLLQLRHRSQGFGLGRKAALGPPLPLTIAGAGVNPVVPTAVAFAAAGRTAFAFDRAPTPAPHENCSLSHFDFSFCFSPALPMTALPRNPRRRACLTHPWMVESLGTYPPLPSSSCIALRGARG